MDLLEKELGVSIQHAHYNLETMLVDGSEYKIHNLRVDGFYVDADNEQVAVEFLGDVWHGHPSLWGKKNRWGVDYKTLFQSTEERFQKICQLGYRVIYVWQKDFKKRDETQRLPIKTFQGELV
jgi:G:T-mismatch repair DNA endonuclease (very short patch repair protein)